ncbi:MAG: hypothetical protein U0Y68_11115 [Blastocatellia bacterium]
MSKKTVRDALSVALMVTVGSFYSLVTSTAFAQVTPKLVGFLATKGSVSLNSMNATSGATVFTGSQIKTSANSSATISLGNLGQVDLGADSELTLQIDSGIIGGHLRSGQATISASEGVIINVTTADGVAAADGKQPSVLTVDVTAGTTRVAAANCGATLTTNDHVEVIAAGQESSGPQGNQKGAPCECRDANGNKTGNGKYNDQGVCECKRSPGGAVAMGGLSPTALFALIVLGVGGAVGGIIAATQGDNVSSSSTGTLSNFR